MDPRKGKADITYAQDLNTQNNLPDVVPSRWTPPPRGCEVKLCGITWCGWRSGSRSDSEEWRRRHHFFLRRRLHMCRDVLEAEVSAFQEGLSMAIHRGNTQHRGAVCVVVTIHHGNPAPTASVVHQPATRTYNFFREHLERGMTYNFRRICNLMHMLIRLSTCACDKVYMVSLIELPYFRHLVISWAVERACLPNLNFVACKCLLWRFVRLNSPPTSSKWEMKPLLY